MTPGRGLVNFGATLRREGRRRPASGEASYGKTEEDMDKKNEEEKVTEEVVAETIDDDIDIPGAAPEEEAQEGKEAEKEAKEDDTVAQMADQLLKLAEENAALKDRIVRDAADTENYKKRLQRDKEEAVKYANTALVKDLIGPLDDFSRALAAATGPENFKALREGVQMIEDKLYSTLKTNWGLEVVDEEGVPFDPEEHEACLMEEDEGVDCDTVSMILQKGYKLNGRVVRPAKVKVARPKS